MTLRHKTMILIAGATCCLAAAFVLTSHWAVNHVLGASGDPSILMLGHQVLLWLLTPNLLLATGIGLLMAGVQRIMHQTAETERRRANEELARVNEKMERRVNARIEELARANEALSAEVAERQRIEALMEDGSRRKDEFLAMLAHELRNPLAPIRNAVHVLHAAGEDQDMKKRQWEIIDRQVSHMACLLDDLLDVGRITQGKIRLIHQTLDLRQVVESALEAMQGPAREHQHTLIYEKPGAPFWVRGDATRLEQVTFNLLHNAVKYTEGPGTIRITLDREEGEKSMAVLSVRDNGIGIAPDVLPHIFGLFVQADRTLDRTQGGLGIGLTLVDRLIQMHGGSVQAFSDGLGLGSEFVVRLPLLAGIIHTEEYLLPAEQLTLNFTPGQPDAGQSSCRVLVVDDNADMARTMGELLEVWGYTVRVAFDGAAAIEVAGAFQPEVILLDIGLPGMNGFEVARCLRQSSAFASTLLIALTGYSQEEDRQRAMESGFDHFLTKPVKLGELKHILEGATIPAGHD